MNKHIGESDIIIALIRNCGNDVRFNNFILGPQMFWLCRPLNNCQEKTFKFCGRYLPHFHFLLSQISPGLPLDWTWVCTGWSWQPTSWAVVWTLQHWDRFVVR